MTSKRASVPTESFGKKPASALDKLTGRAELENFEEENTVSQYNGNTVKRYNGNTVSSTSKKNGEKTTFYLRPDQLAKLDELTYEYNKQTAQRINRNDIIRALVDGCDIDQLLQIITH